MPCAAPNRVSEGSAGVSAVDSMRGAGNGTTGWVLGLANLAGFLAMRIPADGATGIAGPAVGVIVVVVMMMVMGIVDCGRIVDSMIGMWRRGEPGNIVASTQLEQPGLVQLPHIFLLTLPEIVAGLRMISVRGLALRGLLFLLLFQKLRLARQFSA
jgi:hypothetical protein